MSHPQSSPGCSWYACSGTHCGWTLWVNALSRKDMWRLFQAMSSYSTGFSWKQLWPCCLQPCRLSSQAVLGCMWIWAKTFCPHLYGVFHSAPRLGNYYFCPHIKLSQPLGSVTAEEGAGAKSWHITDWGLWTLQASCLLWTSPVLGCCS